MKAARKAPSEFALLGSMKDFLTVSNLKQSVVEKIKKDEMDSDDEIDF